MENVHLTAKSNKFYSYLLVSFAIATAISCKPGETLKQREKNSETNSKGSISATAGAADLVNRTSSLQSHASKLASACYLFQGFPEDVIGSFVYRSKVKKSFETYLVNTFRYKHDAKPSSLSIILKEITNSLYLDTNNVPVLVVDKVRRKMIIQSLERTITQRGLSNLDRLCIYVCCYYLSIKDDGELAANYMQSAKNIKGDVIPIVIENVINVSANLYYSDVKDRQWCRVIIIR